jgi:type I restriction enzyme S subunit
MKRWEEAKDIQIENGDLLITKDGTVGKVAIVDGLDSPCSLNSGVLRISTINGYDRRFLFWVLQSEVFWTWFANKNAGNSTILHLYQGDFAEFNYAIPPLHEQRAIADLLDDRCGQVDGIISDLEKQVEILHRYKKALITETVTANKPHWIKGRIKDLMTLQRGYDLPQDDFIEGDYPVYGSNGIVGWHNKFTTAGPGITIGRSGSVGEVNYVDRDFWAHNTSIFVKNRKGNDIRFLYYALLSFDIKELASGSAVPTLDRKNVEAVHLLFPTGIQEQQTIATYLDEKCAEIDALTVEKRKATEVMRQYKKSLIYEYVTGKKRVIS